MEILVPFASNTEKFSVEGDFRIGGNKILLNFSFKDPDKVLIDAPAERIFEQSQFQRADKLWQSTCFEAFWGVPKENHYWEFNVAADGRWNLYFFNSYRLPQPPTPSLDFDLKKMQTSSQSLTCILEAGGPLGIPFDVSLCTVLKTAKNTYFYSTKHVGQKPDFHARESFVLRRENEIRS